MSYTAVEEMRSHVEMERYQVYCMLQMHDVMAYCNLAKLTLTLILSGANSSSMIQKKMIVDITYTHAGLSMPAFT
jgi:hypothetical protein